MDEPEWTFSITPRKAEIKAKRTPEPDPVHGATLGGKALPEIRLDREFNNAGTGTGENISRLLLIAAAAARTWSGARQYIVISSSSGGTFARSRPRCRF
jgi:hypothetical protein